MSVTCWHRQNATGTHCPPMIPLGPSSPPGLQHQHHPCCIASCECTVILVGPEGHLQPSGTAGLQDPLVPLWIGQRQQLAILQCLSLPVIYGLRNGFRPPFYQGWLYDTVPNLRPSKQMIGVLQASSHLLRAPSSMKVGVSH